MFQRGRAISDLALLQSSHVQGVPFGFSSAARTSGGLVPLAAFLSDTVFYPTFSEQM